MKRKIPSGSIVLLAATICAVLLPLSAQSQFLWSQRVASTIDTDNELSIGMTLDSQANCYVTGWFDGTNDFGGVILTNDSGGGQDIFVAKYNSSGALQWANRAGGSSANRDAGRGIGVDTNGNVYVTGGYYGPANFGSINLPASPSQDFFLAKYNNAGTVQWVQQGVGGQDAYGTGLAVDGAGNSYALVVANNGDTITFGSTNVTTPSDFDANFDASTILVKYDNTGTVKWAQVMGGYGETYATKVAVDTDGNVYVRGGLTSTLTIGTSNLVVSTGSTENMFLAKFNNSGALIWVQQPTGGNVGEGGVAVDQAENVYVSGPFSTTMDFGSGISLTNAGSFDAFVAKYGSSGAIQWAQRAGGTNADDYWDVALDAQANVYAAGFLNSGAAVAKYDPAGTLQWTYSASGPPASPVSSLVAKCAVDSTGNCYLAGWYQGTATFGTNVLQPRGYWNYFLSQAQAFTFGPQFQSTPSASITYNSGTGTFQYTDAANSSDDYAGLPLTGNAAAYITAANGWTASLTANLSTITMTATSTEEPFVGMGLFVVFNNSFANTVGIALQQVNDTGIANYNLYGTGVAFTAKVNGQNVQTTPLDGSQLQNNGTSILLLSEGTSDTPATETINAASGVLTFTNNPSTGILTGYYNGVPVGSISLTDWGPNPSLTLYVVGLSGEGVNVGPATNTASVFSAGPSSVSILLAVATTSLPNGTNGVAYSQTLAAIGGQTPYSWTNISGALPPGLTLAANGSISGTPTTNGTNNFTVRVTDALSATATHALTLIVLGTNVVPSFNLVLNGGFETGDFTGWTSFGSDPEMFIDDGSQTGIEPHSGNYLAALGPVGSLSYLSQTLATTAGAVYPLSLWLNSDGSTPNEFLVSWNGTTLFDEMNLPAIGWTNIQFTVTATGTNTVLLFGARDDSSFLGLDDISVMSTQFPPLVVVTALLPNGTNGVAYSQTLTATGGKTPYSWTNSSGSLASGLKLAANGVISGTPTTNGTNNFTVKVTDSLSSTATQALTLTVVSPPSATITPTNHSVTVTLGSNVSLSVSAAGTGPFSYQWQLNGTNLPNGIITTVAGNGTNGYSGDGGAATNAELSDPADVAVDTTGNLFIADSYNERIRKVGANGIITTVAGNGTKGFSGDGGAATNAELYWPLGATVDATGNLFIADTGNSRIRKVGTNGIITTVAGNGKYGYSGDGGTATNAELYFPAIVAVDATGNLFIADTYNQRIRKVGTNGIITTVAGNGKYGYSGDGGSATNAELDGPDGVAVDATGNLFIGDSNNQRIRKVGTSGIITTVAGNGTNGYSGDGGAATNAELNDPADVAVDTTGNLLIADYVNNRIRNVDTSGIITTVAGGGFNGLGDGGAATNAELNGPYGVAVDATGNLFIADQNHNRIRKVVNPAVSVTGPTLVLNNVGFGNAGAYDVVVSNLYGGVTSSVVNLIIISAPVVLSAPQITLGSTNFTFLLSGPSGSNYVLQASTNLLNWSSVSTSTIPVSRSINLTNPISGYNRHFYRAYLQ